VGLRTTGALLEVRALDAWYGAAHILHGVSLVVGRGEVVALMGRNGAGKSTTLKAIMGMVQRRSEGLSFMGRSVTRLRPFEMARLVVGCVDGERRVFRDWPVDGRVALGELPPRRGPDRWPAVHWTGLRLYELVPVRAPPRARLAATQGGRQPETLNAARGLI